MGRETARLLISCRDTKGLVAAVAGFISMHDGNILESDHHTDAEHGEFFMRVEIDLDGFGLTKETFTGAWQPIAEKFGMKWRVAWGNEIRRMGILVSKQGHCLNDLLWRWKTGELKAEIPFVASNHPDMQEVVESFGLPYHHFPVTPESKPKQEKQLLKMARETGVDFLVLARYMQILTPSFLEEFSGPIINIHHSFLPAFIGKKPYHQAHERGVKIIGATSHYVTADLDEGAIIAQDTTPIDHRDKVEDLVRKGRDLERVVLAGAVRLHLEDKVLAHRNKTIVFD